MNTTTITGNLVRDPELRYTTTGQAVANFTVADNRRWADRTTSVWQETTTYLDIVAWGQLGEHTAGSVRKGDRVAVTGRFEQRSWDTPEGGKRTKVEVNATDVAASLRWATAAVTKAEHTDTDDNSES